MDLRSRVIHKQKYRKVISPAVKRIVRDHLHGIKRASSTIVYKLISLLKQAWSELLTEKDLEGALQLELLYQIALSSGI